ncbi:LOW QUALITY PROTEIN: hypothetical protein M8C21_008474, partial [Ambrosia artemisiifolia]
SLPMANTESINHLHFILIPFLAPGHTIPMIDMAKLLALRPNVTVTIVTTPLNAIRYGSTLQQHIKSGLPVQFLELPFPSTENGLPEGCESADALPGLHLLPNFAAAVDMLQLRLEQRFELLKPTPSCIISDKYMLWAGDTTAKYKIPLIIFDGMSCFKQLCTHHLYSSKVVDELTESKPFVLPGLPASVAVAKSPLCNSSSSALEASKSPFIWVIRAGDGAKEVEKWLSENGFENRIKDRGLIIRDWAPQLVILSHPSVGGFLTHCGWNSMLEGVSAGVPMITWPQFAEQFLNEKLVVDVLGIGVGVGAPGVVHWGEEDRFGVTVKREQIKTAIEKVMEVGSEGNERRTKVKALGMVAKKAIEEGGSSHHNLTLLIQDLMELANFLELPFPSTENGLPEGCESADALPGLHLFPNFSAAVDLLQQRLEQRFDSLDPQPICVLSDKYMLWTGDTAAKYKIPLIIFDGMSCFKQLASHHLYASKVFDDMPKLQPFVLPGLPDQIEITRAQLPTEFNPSRFTMREHLDRVREIESRAYGMVINSFEELEEEYFKGFKELKGGKVWCLGPLSLSNSNDSGKSLRGNSIYNDDRRYVNWLNSKEPGSVVYACFGSSSQVTPPQLIELGFALEASKYPFIWVIRAVLEGVSAGVPMITWPQFAEQFLNEKLIVHVLGIGVGVGAQGVVHWGEEDRFGVTVKSEQIKTAIEKVMEVGSEGNERRTKVKAHGMVAKKAIEEGGSSHHNLTLLIQDLLELAN